MITTGRSMIKDQIAGSTQINFGDLLIDDGLFQRGPKTKSLSEVKSQYPRTPANNERM